MWSQAGRLVGILAAVLVFSFWLFFVRYNPFGDMGASPAAFGQVLLMLVLSLAAMLAALRTKPLMMLTVFALSLIPFGMYILTVPGLRWAGLLNGLFLLSGLFMLKGQRDQPASRRQPR